MKIGLIKENNFLSDDKKYISGLELNEDFNQLILIARLKGQIPETGIIGSIAENNLFKPIDHSFSEVLKNANMVKIMYWLKIILSVFDLPESWGITILSIILFNNALPPARDKYKKIEFEMSDVLLNVILGKADIFPNLTITIRESCGGELNSLVNLLKKSKKEIEDKLKLLPSSPKVRFQNTEIGKIILKLRNEGLSWDKTAEIVDKEYSHLINFDPSYSTVEKIGKRTKIHIEKMTKNKLLVAVVNLLDTN